MAKLQISALFVLVAVIAFIGSIQAEPQRTQRGVYSSAPVARYQRPRTRYLARQEYADAVPEAPAVTPYPSADELKPAVPFDEAGTNVPDEVYGPPEAPANQPDEVYGPPEVDSNALPVPAAPADEPAADPAAEVFPAPLDEQQARLVAARRVAAYRQRQRQAAAYQQALAARAAPRPIKYRAVAQRRY